VVFLREMGPREFQANRVVGEILLLFRPEITELFITSHWGVVGVLKVRRFTFLGGENEITDARDVGFLSGKLHRKYEIHSNTLDGSEIRRSPPGM